MFNSQMFNSQLTDLYYISLYSSKKPDGIRNMAPTQTTPSSAGASAIFPQDDKSVVILSSQGNACEEGGVVTLLGIYEEKGIHCEVLTHSVLFEVPNAIGSLLKSPSKSFWKSSLIVHNFEPFCALSYTP